MMLNNKILKYTITIILMIIFLIISILFLTKDFMVNNLLLMVLTSLTLLIIITYVSLVKDPIEKKHFVLGPLRLQYWLDSVKEYKKLKQIIFASLMLAIMIVSRQFALPTGFGPLQLRWSFIPWIIAAVVVGPVWAMTLGLMYDVLGFFIFSSTFPFSFTFMALNGLRGLVYGLFLYKTKITLAKIFVMFFAINIIINTILQGIAWGILFGPNNDESLFQIIRTQILTMSLPTNLATFIPRILLVFLILKSILPVLKICGNLDEEVDDLVTII